MSWLNIFKKGEILTQGDRAELEQLEGKTEDLQKLLKRIDEEWVDSMGRMDRITGLAGQLAEDPKNEKLFQRMTLTACMPSATNSGFQHLNGAKRPIEEKIGEIMAPQHAIIRRVLKRALDIAESELRKVEGRERKLAEDEGYDYVPSGKILALQKRILELRNGVALPIPGEDNFRGGLSGWRERLAEWV